MGCQWLRLRIGRGCLFPALVLLGACYSTSFVRTDPTYAGGPGDRPPVFAEQKPAGPLRLVGYIRVEADPIVSEHAIRDVAAREGRKAGCQLLIERRLMKTTAMFPNLRRLIGDGVLLAHGDHDSPAPASAPARDPSSSSVSSTGRDSSASRDAVGARGAGGTSAQGGWLWREFLCAVAGVPGSQPP